MACQSLFSKHTFLILCWLFLFGSVSIVIILIKSYFDGAEEEYTHKSSEELTCSTNYNNERDLFWSKHYFNLHKELEIDFFKLNSTKDCRDSFDDRLEVSMQRARKYPVLENNCFRQYDTLLLQNNSFPVIVTACSSNHFKESLKMIQSVQISLFVSYPGIKLIIYDIGLEPYQLKQLSQYCFLCEIRRFQFEKYKPFVSKLKNYVWKPIIIYTVLQEYKFVIWSDSSVDYFGSGEAYRLLFERIKTVGILVRATDHPNSRLTKQNTFYFFNESPCLFDDKYELEANMIGIWNTDLIWNYVILPWISCALTENCMSAVDPESILACKKPGRHACHRFDQSVLNLILFRLFNTHLSLLINTNNLLPAYNISRGQRRN